MRHHRLLRVDLCVVAALRLCVLLFHPFDLAEQLPRRLQVKNVGSGNAFWL
jgi:hypothetical protein